MVSIAARIAGNIPSCCAQLWLGFTSAHTHTGAQAHRRTGAHATNTLAHTRTHAHTHKRTSAHTHKRTSAQAQAHKRKSTRAHTNAQTDTNAQARTRKPTHERTSTHTCTQIVSYVHNASKGCIAVVGHVCKESDERALSTILNRRCCLFAEPKH